MVKIRTVSSSTILFVCLFSAILSFAGVDANHASRIHITINDNTVDVSADNAPFIDVLKKLADKIGFDLIIKDSVDEVVTFDLKSKDLETCLKQLLLRRNYVLTFRKLDDSSVVPKELLLIGTKVPTIYKARPQDTNNADSHMNRADKKWYEKYFSNPDTLSKQIDVQQVRITSETAPPFGAGIQVTRVSEDSAFSQIGIASGDRITAVNGTPVTSRKELINALVHISTEMNPTIIQIERLDENGQLDPVYVQIN
nr:PDZ domain-containing protein [uncultured Desulfobacter sp.]